MAELAKVTWPTREETRNLTIVVIGISVTLGVFLGVGDMAGVPVPTSQMFSTPGRTFKSYWVVKVELNKPQRTV